MKLSEGITDIKELAYITSRKLENEQESRVEFKRRPYRVKCNNCGKSIMIEKLASK